MDHVERDQDAHFQSLFHQHAGNVRAYAARRVGIDASDEVVAETFLAAWKHLDRVPDEPLPWLYGFARGAVSHYRRGTSRRSALATRIIQLDPPFAAPDVAEIVGASRAVEDAFRALSERDREVLRLAIWERLDAVAGAVALGCSITAFKVRLHRARRRFRQLLAADDRHERSVDGLMTSVPPPRYLMPLKPVDAVVRLDASIVGDDAR